MTSKRRLPGSELDPRAESAELESVSTLRSFAAAKPVSPDSESSPSPVYYEPQPLVAVSDHKTIEVETIKLAEDIDPRKLPTELRLARPNVLPSDSGWPQPDVAVVRSQPPLVARHRWRAPAALLLLLAALLLLVLARGAARRAHGIAQAAGASASALASDVALAPSPAPTLTVPVAATQAAAFEPAPLESASAAPAPAEAAPATPARASKRVSPTHPARKTKPHSSSDPAPNASSPVLAAPSASKPKRAIY